MQLRSVLGDVVDIGQRGAEVSLRHRPFERIVVMRPVSRVPLKVSRGCLQIVGGFEFDACGPICNTEDQVHSCASVCAPAGGLARVVGHRAGFTNQGRERVTELNLKANMNSALSVATIRRKNLTRSAGGRSGSLKSPGRYLRRIARSRRTGSHRAAQLANEKRRSLLPKSVIRRFTSVTVVSASRWAMPWGRPAKVIVRFRITGVTCSFGSRSASASCN